MKEEERARTWGRCVGVEVEVEVCGRAYGWLRRKLWVCCRAHHALGISNGK
jgi:hypothetical protein